MTWVKLDDNFSQHPKVMQAGPLAGWLYVAGLCYCAKYLTDGVIPLDAVPTLTTIQKPMPQVVRLLDAGLWDVGVRSYSVHDYLSFQPSRDAVLEEREKAKKRQAARRSGKEDAA